jgi:hypothetical protein
MLISMIYANLIATCTTSRSDWICLVLEMNLEKGIFAIFVVISENNTLAVKRPAL